MRRESQFVPRYLLDVARGNPPLRWRIVHMTGRAGVYSIAKSEWKIRERVSVMPRHAILRLSEEIRGTPQAPHLPRPSRVGEMTNSMISEYLVGSGWWRRISGPSGEAAQTRELGVVAELRYEVDAPHPSLLQHN